MPIEDVESLAVEQQGTEQTVQQVDSIQDLYIPPMIVSESLTYQGGRGSHAIRAHFDTMRSAHSPDCSRCYQCKEIPRHLIRIRRYVLTLCSAIYAQCD